jgi:hypothetical protein
MERAAKTERNDLFQKLIDKDPTLANLLTGQDPTVRLPASGGTNGNDEGKGEFEGKYSPTFLRLEEKCREKGIELPINRTRPVAGRTDAENDYLNRPDNPGSLIVPEKIAARFALRTHLHDGRLTVYFDPVEGKVKKYRLRNQRQRNRRANLKAGRGRIVRGTARTHPHTVCQNTGC